VPRLVTRNPLTWPTGVTPGYDGSHVAASERVRVSGVYLGNGKTTGSGWNQNGFFDLLHGVNAASNQSNIGHFMDGILGPCYAVGPYSRLAWFNAGGTSSIPYVDEYKGTVACIVRYASVYDPNAASFYEFMSNNNANDGGIVIITSPADGGVSINCPNSSAPYGMNPATAIKLVISRAYFLAIAYDTDSGGSVGNRTNWVLRDLQTGALQAQQGSGASFNPHKLAVNKFYTINGEQFNATGNDTRYATYYWSGKFHSLADLIQWSANPWSFWYPDV
jgi:hypothetical protein